MGFTHLSCESCIYYQKSDSRTIVSAMHVDDFLSIASNQEENEHFKNQLRRVWTISDLGAVHFVFSIVVTWDRPNHAVFLSQTALIDKIVTQFGQKSASPAPVPMDPGLKLRHTDYHVMNSTKLQNYHIDHLSAALFIYPLEDALTSHKLSNNFPNFSIVIHTHIGMWPYKSYDISQATITNFSLEELTQSLC